MYSLLHYGVPVKAAAGENSETVKLINTDHPELNDFAIAEEVTVYGQHDKRPDIVLPKWRSLRDDLNRLPVKHEEWEY